MQGNSISPVNSFILGVTHLKLLLSVVGFTRSQGGHHSPFKQSASFIKYYLFDLQRFCMKKLFSLLIIPPPNLSCPSTIFPSHLNGFSDFLKRKRIQGIGIFRFLIGVMTKMLRHVSKSVETISRILHSDKNGKGKKNLGKNQLCWH